MKILKYHINAPGLDIIEIPEGAEILSVGHQNNVLYLWAKVEPKNKLIQRKIESFETGEDLSSHIRHFLGTVLLDDGKYVLHIYQRL